VLWIAAWLLAAPSVRAQIAPAPARPDRILVKAARQSESRHAARRARHAPHSDVCRLRQSAGRPTFGRRFRAHRPRGLSRERPRDYAEPDFIVHLLLTPNRFRYYNLDLWNLHNVGQYGGTPGARHSRAARLGRAARRAEHHRRRHRHRRAPHARGSRAESLDESRRERHRCACLNKKHQRPRRRRRRFHRRRPRHQRHHRHRRSDDDYGHGSHVAGILGAAGNNTVGVVGVAWSVQIMACKFIDSQGNGSISDAITCSTMRAPTAENRQRELGRYAFSRRRCSTRSTASAPPASSLSPRAQRQQRQRREPALPRELRADNIAVFRRTVTAPQFEPTSPDRIMHDYLAQYVSRTNTYRTLASCPNGRPDAVTGQICLCVMMNRPIPTYRYYDGPRLYCAGPHIRLAAG